MQHFDCVDDMLMKLCKELFHWLNQVANQNEKYSDKVKITNLGYFILVIPPLQVWDSCSLCTSSLCICLGMLLVGMIPSHSCNSCLNCMYA